MVARTLGSLATAAKFVNECSSHFMREAMVCDAGGNLRGGIRKGLETTDEGCEMRDCDYL